MMRVAAATTAFAITVLTAAVAAQTSSRTPIKGVGVDERLGGPPALEQALTHAGLKGSDVGTFVRFISPWAALDEARTTGRWDLIDARLDAFGRLGVPVLVQIEDAPFVLDQSALWSDTIRAIVTHFGTRVSGYEIDAPRGPARPNAPTYAYFLKLAAVQIRSVNPAAVLAQTTVTAADVDWQNALYASDVAPVVDLVPIERDADVIAKLVSQRDPTAVVLTTGLDLAPAGSESARQWLTQAIRRLGDAPPTAAVFSGSAEAVETAQLAARDLKDLLGANLIALDPASSSLTLRQGGTDVSARVPHRLLYNPSNGATYFVWWGVAATEAPLAMSLV